MLEVVGIPEGVKQTVNAVADAFRYPPDCWRNGRDSDSGGLKRHSPKWFADRGGHECNVHLSVDSVDLFPSIHPAQQRPVLKTPCSNCPSTVFLIWSPDMQLEGKSCALQRRRCIKHMVDALVRLESSDESKTEGLTSLPWLAA